jgi:hypothetical protein
LLLDKSSSKRPIDAASFKITILAEFRSDNENNYDDVDDKKITLPIEKS